MEVSKSTTQKENTQLETKDIPVKFQNINRREFMKLPLAERRRILAEQAELMLVHYQQDREWQELQTGDLVDY
ncbi:hypothetical protein FNW02_11725 [Komarekiella sp. 'clone 1']|uniref:Uncharacterized protein n=1 Tax=Komarekiella delphini-convector SJRDD-AB1 TaxID=2593771 RepID=A0AA40SWD1_9NOST|nr:hypothetical protein [Komarekiella delphini-convector]MBD6616489.1 hypothetical protein [Komarekiella delphini-convector SJRDD-AB1]